MAAGLGFKTFTTGEVLTAADTNGYLMQGVNVFADAAARTAAITSPQEGQMSYLKDTNSTEYYSGSSWVAVGAASGGMTLISTTTLTGATVSLTSIPATYNDLRLVIQKPLPATDSKYFLMRFNGDSTANRHASISGTSQTNTAFASTAIGLGDRADNSVTQGLIIIDIFNYANTTTWKLMRQTSIVNNATTTTNYGFEVGHGAYNQTSAISSLDFIVESGGNFTSGTVLLYGVK